MLSLVESASIVSQNTLFTTLMSTLKHQLSNFDCSIFHVSVTGTMCYLRLLPIL